MSRSRASNRFNRFAAKKRREALRSSVPGLSEGSHKQLSPISDAHKLLDNALCKELLIDLMEPQVDENT